MKTFGKFGWNDGIGGKALLLALVAAAVAQGQSSAPGAESGPTVAEQGPHHRVWRQAKETVSPDGKILRRTNSFTELATGLHYFQDGQWNETKELIEVAADGSAVAHHGPHRATFLPNANTAGAVTLVLPDGTVLRSHVLGLCYFDGATQGSVMIAQIKDCIGEIVAPNQVIYRDAFTDFKADIRYTYTKAGFEQDIICRERLAPPAAYGLSNATSRLEVMTEFLAPPEPAKRVNTFRNGLTDETLDFGSMRIGAGKAFRVDASPSAKGAVSVVKQWLELSGRRVLIEAVPYREIEPLLALLVASTPPKVPSDKLIASGPRFLPDAKKPKPASGKILMARNDTRIEDGVVIDYSITSSATNFTFKGDTTYLVSGSVSLSGTTTIEGGTVIKYTNSSAATIWLLDAVDCQTSPYRPAVFTTYNDDRVGESMPGSTGTPAMVQAAAIAFPEIGPTEYSFSNLRMSWFATAIKDVEDGDYYNPREFKNSQFVNCGTVFQTFERFNYRVRNCLVYNCTNFTDAVYLVMTAENLTLHQVNMLDTSGGTALLLSMTNSLLVAVTNTNSYSGSYNVVLTNASGVFQTAGVGAHYLATGSTNRDAGTTNINATLLAELRTKTTYPPTVHSNVTIATNLTLSPQAIRDTNAPDLGYHYDTLDFAVGGVLIDGATLTLAPGVAVGGFQRNDYYTSDYSLRFVNGGGLTAVGTPGSPIQLARYDTVQEGVGGGWTTAWRTGLLSFEWYGSAGSVIEARFLKSSILAQESQHFYGGYGDVTGNGTGNFTSCEFYGGWTYTSGNVLNYTICLFWRSSYEIEDYSRVKLRFRNSTFLGGGYVYAYGYYPYTNSVRDCFFDKTEISITPPSNADFRNNAYVTGYNTLLPTNINDVYLASASYETGALGRFYVPTNSALRNAGSETNAGASASTISPPPPIR